MKQPSAADLELIESLEFASPAEQLRGWKSLSKKYPDDVITQLNYSATLLDSGDTRAARRVCEQTLARRGRQREIVAQLALVTHAEGDSDQALALADEAIALDYRWPPVLALRASVLSERGETTAAAAEFLAAYLAEPHAWDCLRQYCELTGREYRAPDEKPAPTLGPLARAWLYHFVDHTAHERDAAGNVPGCDHTLRFVERWCQVAGHDAIETYQFVNANGGFCDCEVIFNTESDDEILDCLALFGGTLTPAPSLRKSLLAARVAVETEAMPAIELNPSEDDAEAGDEDDDDAGDDEEPVLLEKSTGALMLWPQLARGRAWGALAHAVATQADPGATFWAAVIPLGDPRRDRQRPGWAWVCSDGKSSEWRIQGERLPEDMPAAVREVIAAGFEKLAAAISSAPP